MNTSLGLSWLSILRLGLVQAALGSVVVLTTSTLNRVMAVELALAASIPGALVGWHYAVQMTRPLFGHRGDGGNGRTAWIIGGVALLALSGTGAAATTLLFEQSLALGIAAAVAAFGLIGVGIGASGTSLLALLASRTAADRRPAAATIVWIMMIAGIVMTAVISGKLLDPYSHERLIAVTAGAGAISLTVTLLAVAGVERSSGVVDGENVKRAKLSFRDSLSDAWSDPDARIFTVFVFVSMLAYSTQDLILEPFGGLLFGMTPGETTALAGMQHGGVLVGMAIVGIVGGLLAKTGRSVLKGFVVLGCVGSGVALALLAIAARMAPDWPLALNIFALGFANGAFAVAAIAMMMTLAGQGGEGREGIRMGLWGASQAIAFGLGGFMGTVMLDAARAVTGDVAFSFALVFSVEAILFVGSALIAMRLRAPLKHGAIYPAYLTPAE